MKNPRYTFCREFIP